ncbi:1,2-dihydroxy-3-keto-5-methylthiopentene dioxygenase, partial [Perkinsus chesapeaki]
MTGIQSYSRELAGLGFTNRQIKVKIRARIRWMERRKYKKELAGSGERMKRDENKRIVKKARYLIATWNVMSMITTGGPSAIAKDLLEKGVDVALIQETRWEEEQSAWRCGEYYFWRGGAWRSKNGARVGGVAIVVHQRRKEDIIDFRIVSGRLAYMVIKGRAGRNLKLVSAYGPTEEATDDIKNKFWYDMEKVLEDTKEIDEIVSGGDFNGETGGNTGDPALGIHGVGLRNRNGERLVEYANTRGLSIVASNFIKKDVKKYTMRGNFQVDEGGRKFREYDHFLVRSRDKRTIKDVKNRWDTFHHSDHSLRLLYIEMKPCGVRDMKRNNNISVRLRSLEGGIAVNEELKGNNYKDIMDETSNISLEERWYKLKQGIKKGLERCPKNGEKRKPWISQNTWIKMKLRNEMWERVEKGTNHYGHLLEVRKEVKRMLKADKREWLKQQTEKAENAARVNNLKELYAIIRMLSGKRYSGVDLTGMDMNAFINHFESLLGRQVPDQRSEYEQRRAFHLAKNSSEIIGKEWSIDNTPPSDDEVIKMCKKMRNNKAVGMDELPTELFKNSEECQKVLGIIIRAFWRGEKLVEEHYTAILVTLFKGKCSRKEPGGYRGISLLSFVERIVSLIILERVKEAVEKRLLKHQYGFTSGKSCRDPVRLLWNKWESTMKIASVFVDFQKAFDSL